LKNNKKLEADAYYALFKYMKKIPYNLLENNMKNICNNEEISNLLFRIADLLDAQDGNPGRIMAYRNGARIVRIIDQSIAEMVEKGEADALEKYPGIGSGLSGAIAEYVRTGNSGLLNRLEGEISPEALFATVQGISKKLSYHIHAKLAITTLEELEMAAYDGRLENMRGIGARRIQAIRASLDEILHQSSHQRIFRRRQNLEAEKDLDRPNIQVILDVDTEYLQRAKAGKLKTITTRRFNPEGKAWLPILHTEREEWSFTALYSNTSLAHELDMIKDWVAVYYQHGIIEGQCTVVTERRRPCRGKRIIRGRERECYLYYGFKTHR
jgi:DNA polymerase (family X)